MGRFNLNLENETADSIEQGDFAPAGYFHCRLEDAYDDEKYPGMTRFKWKILSGPYTGKYILDSVGDPDAVEAEKAPVVQRRVKLLAKRLGLIGDSAYGGSASGDWADAIGVETIIKHEVREYKKRDGTMGKAHGPAFDGIYPLDYPQDKFPKDFAEHRGFFGDVLTGPEKSEPQGKAAATTTGSATAGSASGKAASGSGGAAKKPRFSADNL